MARREVTALRPRRVGGHDRRSDRNTRSTWQGHRARRVTLAARHKAAPRGDSRQQRSGRLKKATRTAPSSTRSRGARRYTQCAQAMLGQPIGGWRLSRKHSFDDALNSATRARAPRSLASRRSPPAQGDALGCSRLERRHSRTTWACARAAGDTQQSSTSFRTQWRGEQHAQSRQTWLRARAQRQMDGARIMRPKT